uniref:type IX secretion system motor protein PorL/GldL n=2 Tax=Algoriphagus sp. TaxID=1872435 RepID=UPI004047E7B1
MANFKEKFFTHIMPKITGIGASVVILGAMFKILDWPGASWMIGIGLSTEALIFFLSAFEPIHKEVDWSKVYPELNEEEAAPAKKKTVVASGDPIAAQLDNMLAQANIGPELIESLGKGMQNLASSAEKMGNLSDAAVATTEYAAQVQTASKTLASMNDSYAQTATALMAMSSASQDAQAYQVQIQAVTKNLAALNAVYELELQDTADQKKTRADFYKNMSTAMSSFTEVGNETQAFKEEMVKLNQNVSALSKIYGGMLTAIKG